MKVAHPGPCPREDWPIPRSTAGPMNDPSGDCNRPHGRRAGRYCRSPLPLAGRGLGRGSPRAPPLYQLGMTMAELEREYIRQVLRRTGGNKAQAAEWLGISRLTLYRRLEEYGIPPEV